MTHTTVVVLEKTELALHYPSTDYVESAYLTQD